MRRLRRQSIAQLSRVKRWQWFLLSAVILSSAVVWCIHRTEFLAGVWGILNDEIAVVTIEGEEQSRQDITITDPSKSVWDGLELLGVPLVLAVLGAWFQKSQQEQADRIAKEQREQDGDETREEVLQLYFDRISALLIDKGLMAIAAKKEAFDEIKRDGAQAKVMSSYNFTEREGSSGIIRSSAEDIPSYLETKDYRSIKKALSFSQAEQELLEVATDVIQARTLSILRRFEQDSERKSSVIRFLVEADVIDRLKISLSGTNLSSAILNDADLRGATLDNVNLSSANLSGAKLSGANLVGADLSDANLSDANFFSTNFFSTHLFRANLFGADLNNADLSGAEGLTKEQLERVLLCDTKLPEDINLDPNRDCEYLEGLTHTG